MIYFLNQKNGGPDAFPFPPPPPPSSLSRTQTRRAPG
jgi:hypothetical protein